MKLAVQYVNDINGEVQAVQLPFNEWKKVLNKISKYEQALKLKSELQEALDEVSILQSKKAKKQTLKEFLNEL